MSDDTLNVALVCEGPTDAEYLKSILNEVFDSPYVLTVIQPDMDSIGSDYGPNGGGWIGVRKWCEMYKSGGGQQWLQSLPKQFDLYIIHVDGDVALDSRVKCQSGSFDIVGYMK